MKRRRAFLEGLEQRQLMAIDVGVIGGSGDTSGFAAIVNQLNDDTYYDFNATLLTEADADTVGELSAYDVVVVGNSGSGGIDYSQFETALRAYVEAGGGVVSTGWTLDFASQVTHPDLAAVVPVTMGNYKFTAPGTVVISNTTHPITSGLTDFAASQLDGSVVAAIGGSNVLTTASYSAPAALLVPGAVAANIGAGKSVYLSPIYSAATSYGNADLRSGMADRLLEQGVAWAADALDVADPTISAALIGGNLTITDTSGNNNHLTISNNGAGGLVITDTAEGFASTGGIAGATLSNGNKTLTVPIASITGAQIVINGTDGDDTLTVDLTNAMGKIVTFNGGDPTTVPGDKLVVTGGTFATGTLNHTNPTDGSVVFGANTINYTGLEPVDVTGTTITDLVINLPDITGTPDDTELSISGGNLLVTSLNGTHESDSIALAAFTTVTINTRMGDDTLRLDATMAAFDKQLILNGNLGADVFVFETALSAAVSVTVNGNAGTNRLQLPGIAAANVVLSNVDADGADGTETTTNINFSDIARLNGDGTSSLTGTNVPSTWVIDDGATSTYATNLEFSGFKTLTGGDGVDTFNVRNNTALSYTLNGGAGLDAFHLGSAANKLDSIANIAVDGGVGRATLTLHDQGNTTAFDYTLTATTIGRDAGGAATFTGLTSLNLNTGSGSNKVTMTGIPSAADIAGVIGLSLSAGDDTLDISAVGPATVNLGAPAADPTGFNANLVTGARTSAFSGVEHIIASTAAAGDQLRGINVDSTWTINDGSTNTYLRNSEPARTLNFTGMDVLQGGSQIDTFNVQNNSTTATYSLKGGAGIDAFNFGDANSLAGITNPIGVDGEVAGATLTLNDQATNAAVNYSITANSIGRTPGGAVTFGGITDLTLNATNGANTINVTALPTVSVATTLNGGAGSDTLDLSGSGIVAVNLTGGDAIVGFDGDFSGVNFTSIETFLGLTPAALSVTLDASNNLVIDDTSAAGKDNSLSIERVGANIVITDAAETFANAGGIAGATLSNGGKTLTVPVASIAGTKIIVNGGVGADTLTVDLTTALGKIVDFNGGDPLVAPGDKLVVTGGTHATGTLNHTNATDGSVVLGANTINYAGLEPVDITGTTITDLVINLPDIAGTPDDTELSIVGGSLVVTSLNASHELDNIALAAFTTVTVNARSGDDIIRLDATMSTFDKALTLNGDAGADKFVFETAIAAPGTITVNGGAGSDSLDYSAFQVAAVDTAVDVSLTVTAADGFSGDVKVGANTIASFAGIDSVSGNSNTTTDSLSGLNANSTWTINEPASSTYLSTGTLGFASFEKLNGGSADDHFVVTNPAAVAFTLAGGAGTDSLDVSALGATTVTVTDDGAVAGFDGTFGASNFSSIDSFLGAAGSTFTGDNADSTWTIDDGGTSTYATAARTASIAGFNNLQGGSAQDTFNVLNNSATNSYSLKGGAGVDAFNFGQADSLANISKNIAVDGEIDAATLTLNDHGVATDLDYTLGANTVGRDTGGTVTYSAITDLTLNATDGANRISVTGIPTASGSTVVNGGNGDDTLDFSNFKTGGVPVDTGVEVVLTAAANNYNGNVRLATGGGSFLTFADISNFIGNAAKANDRLTSALNTDSDWTIDATPDVNPTGRKNTYVDLVSNKVARFNQFEVINGGDGIDTFTVLDNDPAGEYQLFGNANADKFIIGTPANQLAGLAKLSVNGGQDAGDTLTLNDHGEAGDKNYTISPTTAAVSGGVTVTHSLIETITLNASKGLNAITVLDSNPTNGNYTVSAGGATNIKLVDASGASTLAVNDDADVANNTWSVNSSQVVRSSPTPTLTVDYSAQTTITNLSLAGGKAVDNVTVSSTKVATTIEGNEDNDIFTVGDGDLDNFAGQLTIDGGGNAADTRTVFRGGTISNTVPPVFTAASDNTIEKGDKLTISDALQGGVTRYSVNSTAVSRTGAAHSVSYSNIEELSLLAGSDESDITVTVPSTLPVGTTQLPSVVSIDGGNAGKDNRVQVKGSASADLITVGNATANESDRSQIELTSVTRLWIEGHKGADVLHNRSSVPGLIDGGYQKASNASEVANLAVTDDIIVSDAPSTTTFSPVLLGNDGADVLYTTNSSASGTTYLVGDYFINNTVPFVQGSLATTSRLQVVGFIGETGDRYVSAHTPAINLRNRVLARLDYAADSYFGRFANLTADTIGSSLSVIEWLRGRLPLTISATGMAGELAHINYQIRLFTREPGSAAAPSFPNATYNPGGLTTAILSNGGEFVDDSSAEYTPLVQNPFDAADVNGDGRVNAFDALLIINELNRNGSHTLDTSPDGEFGVNGGGEENRPIDFLDTNGDGAVSAFDALVVINRLNANGATTYEVPDAYSWFEQADAAELAAAEWAASQLAESQALPNSVTDEALLALLAAGDGEGDQE